MAYDYTTHLLFLNIILGIGVCCLVCLSDTLDEILNEIKKDK